MKKRNLFLIILSIMFIFISGGCSIFDGNAIYLPNKSLEVREYADGEVIADIVSSLNNEIELTKEELKAMEELAAADRVKVEYNDKQNSIVITENENTRDEVITAYYPDWIKEGIARLLPEPTGASVITTTLEADYCNVFMDISYKNAKAYVSELKNCGFTVGASMSEDDETFTYTAYNKDDVYIEFFYALEMGSIELRR